MAYNSLFVNSSKDLVNHCIILTNVINVVIVISEGNKNKRIAMQKLVKALIFDRP